MNQCTVFFGGTNLSFGSLGNIDDIKAGWQSGFLCCICLACWMEHGYATAMDRTPRHLPYPSPAISVGSTNE